MVSTLGARSRQQALDARRAARRAEALQALAHAVVADASGEAVLTRAARCLSELFDAPAAILARTADGLTIRASAGDATLSPADRSAARSRAVAAAPTHGGVYPTDRARFDFWPVILHDREALAVGVDFTRAVDGRSADAQGQVEAVCGYLTSLREAKRN